MSELLHYRYQARAKQVAEITLETGNKLEREIAGYQESYEALDILLIAPPIALLAVMSELAYSDEELFKLLAPATEITAKKTFVLDALYRLFTACNPERRGFKEVAIDEYHLPIPLEYQTAFQGHEDTLNLLADQGKNNGIKMLLASIEGKFPLLRYRRDLIKGKFPLSPSLDGGTICYLDTKIPGVNLKCWYPRSERLPKLSLTVEELKEAKG